MPMIDANLDGELWWGGRVVDGAQMPYAPGFTASLVDHGGNQAAGQLVSNKGRVIWADEPFAFTCLLYTSPSPRDRTRSRMPSSA